MSVFRYDPSWPRFIDETRRAFALFALVAGILTGWRVVFYLRFAEPAGIGEVTTALLHGLRFDARIATLVLAPAILLTIASGAFDLSRPNRRLCDLLAYLYMGVTPFFGLVAIGYYAEFGRPFGLNVFELIYDDTGAILATMAREYGLVSRTLVAALVSAGLIWLYLRWRRRGLADTLWNRLARASGWRRPIVVALFATLLVGAARGSFGGRPAMRKWSSVTSDRGLNDGVMPPWSWLIYALRDRARLARPPRLEALLPDGDVRAAAQRFFATDTHAGSLDDYFARSAAGHHGERPRHVFLIVMESYDVWSLMPRYRRWGASERLSALADRGLFLRHFLPGSESTMATLSALLLGLPDAGLFTARQPSAQQTFAGSLPATMRRLGYRTRLFYGGMLSWQRLGDFATAQGFDETYGRSQMDPQVGGAWGLEDEQLFDFATGTVDADTPSFNLILTLSNHPPYDLDLADLGFEAPADFEPSPRLSPRHLGHLWYADQQLGRFVSQIETHYPDSLFLLTGDHFSRRHPSRSPDFYEASAVPLVLYGPTALAGRTLPADAAGSHIDLMPTLVELCAPAGFPYAAAGRDLLAPAEAPLGHGHDRVIGPDFILDLREEPRLHPLPGIELPALSPERVAQIAARHRELLSMAWWRIMRGPTLPE